MSAVPMQGVVLTEATTVKRRGPRGELGKGTPGSRLKSYWHMARRRDSGLKGSLRYFINLCAKYTGTEPTSVLNAKDANAWLDAKANPPKRVRKQRTAKTTATSTVINVPKRKAAK